MNIVSLHLVLFLAAMATFAFFTYRAGKGRGRRDRTWQPNWYQRELIRVRAGSGLRTGVHRKDRR